MPLDDSVIFAKEDGKAGIFEIDQDQSRPRCSSFADPSRPAIFPLPDQRLLAREKERLVPALGRPRILTLPPSLDSDIFLARRPEAHSRRLHLRSIDTIVIVRIDGEEIQSGVVSPTVFRPAPPRLDLRHVFVRRVFRAELLPTHVQCADHVARDAVGVEVHVVDHAVLHMSHARSGQVDVVDEFRVDCDR